MVRILPGDPVAVRPWTVTHGVHPLRLRLSPASRRVRAGTPLRPSPLGWEACPAAEAPWAFSADYKQPGDECTAWREVTIDTGHVLGPPGTRLRLAAIGDDGAITLEADPDGPHVVLWDSYVLFTIRSPLTLNQVAEAVLAHLGTPDPEPDPEPDYLNRPGLE